MTSKAEDKVEIVVQVESKDTSSKVILIMLIIVPVRVSNCSNDERGTRCPSIK